MGLKHAIHTLVRRDASPAHETKAGPAAKSNNESFKSIRNFVYVFVHRNDSAAVEENDTEQDALTHRDLRRFPGGYQLGEHHLGHTGGSRVLPQRGAITDIPLSPFDSVLVDGINDPYRMSRSCTPCLLLFKDNEIGQQKMARFIIADIVGCYSSSELW